MFNWFARKNKTSTSPPPSPSSELASIKYSITLDQSLSCEIKINIFNELSANCFGKLLLLIEQGDLIVVTVEALQMLYENNVEEQTQFVDQVLTHWKTESDKIIQPFIKPTDVFKEK